MTKVQWLVITLAILALACFFAAQVDAHGDADWIRKDPLIKDCCTKKDCKQLADGDVIKMPGGWLIQSTGEFVPFSEALVSINHHFWVCRYDDGRIRKFGERLCLFAPPRQSTLLFKAADRRGAVCGNRLVIIRRLAEMYQEHLDRTAIDATGAAVEYFASASGTWTMLFTMPGMPTCVGASGDGWGPAPADGTATRTH